jgi:hypothetical protein
VLHSTFSEDGFAMYEYICKELGFRMPFSEFTMGVFRRLKLAHSQLNPNSMAFIRAFELVCECMEIVPTVRLFFTIFQIQRQPTKDKR